MRFSNVRMRSRLKFSLLYRTMRRRSKSASEARKRMAFWYGLGAGPPGDLALRCTGLTGPTRLLPGRPDARDVRRRELLRDLTLVACIAIDVASYHVNPPVSNLELNTDITVIYDNFSEVVC